ncbi:hypothetical protein [Chryseolinea sp. H1M3-3]|uniref:hypothetical protein n=1 Tax=Chryseolinea sp. H1M3-3 TaxID=3034144 RepID=UPI0023EDC19C|nr:hypothetical protein [Chryseolinea sp. H1M3-3]
MLSYIRLPLLFFFLASLFGIFLRWQFVWPTPGITYAYFLHGHSHTMFLGWVFNVLYIAYTITYIQPVDQKIFKILFVLAQLLVVAMMISFPIQGYGTYSIIFSTLHTFVALSFVILFLKKTASLSSTSVWFARVSLIFFFISTAGPFSLGYIMANGLGQSQWYYFSIYYYLHFQYNGFFMFGVFSIFFHLLDTKQIHYDIQKAKSIGRWMAIACVPAYFLSVLWARPGLGYNLIAGLAGLIQLYVLASLIAFIMKLQMTQHFSRPSYPLLVTALLAFSIKTILQFLSAFPSVAALAYELKPIVIAYLHLILIGVITALLLVWYIEKEFLYHKALPGVIATFLIGFIGSEITLVLQPWWSSFLPDIRVTPSQIIFLFSAILSVCCFLFLYTCKTEIPDKNQKPI